jgi:preprotein translocase subunit SecG
MSPGRHPLWPSLVLVAGYLASDLFLSGIGAAVFVAGLGAAVFLVLLAFARIPAVSLLVEGIVLGAVGYAGELTGRPGAGFAFLELTAAAVFLVSAAAGRPYLQGQVRSLTGSALDPGLAARMTLVMGGVFLVHGALLTVMLLTSGIGTVTAVAAFAALYLAALVLLRRKGGRDAAASVPVLEASRDSGFLLRKGDAVLGSIDLLEDRIAEVTVISLSASPEEFLKALEVALAREGTRTVRISSWQGDTGPLEVSGYICSGGCWQRILPAFR